LFIAFLNSEVAGRGERAGELFASFVRLRFVLGNSELPLGASPNAALPHFGNQLDVIGNVQEIKNERHNFMH